jgi:hypothetical protein
MTPIKKLVFISITLAMVLGIVKIFGEIAVRIIAPQNLSSSFRISDKHGIQVHQPGESSSHQLGERVAKYKLRPDGLREYGAANAENRILLLGDSFTFGWLLNAEHTYIKHLQTKIDEAFGKGRMELLNGGHGVGEPLTTLDTTKNTEKITICQESLFSSTETISSEASAVVSIPLVTTRTPWKRDRGSIRIRGRKNC